MVDQTGDVTGAPKTAAAAEGSVARPANARAGTVAGGDSADADVDIGPAGIHSLCKISPSQSCPWKSMPLNLPMLVSLLLMTFQSGISMSRQRRKNSPNALLPPVVQPIPQMTLSRLLFLP